MPKPVAMSDRLLASEVGSVYLLTLNRPGRRNALDSALVDDLLEAFRSVRRNDAMRAVVLTGTPPAFCAGGDLTDVPIGTDAAALAARHRGFVELAQTLRTFVKPVVAAVNGVAVGAGAALALATDHTVMAADASLRFSFLAVGLPPDLLSVSLLHNRAGSTVATDLLYSGRLVEAGEAKSLHLIAETAPPEDVVGRAVEAARRLGELPPFAFATTKSLVRHAATLGDALVDVEPFAVGAAAASREFLEATARFRP
ncbi:MAG: enoyl-CoA hydratase/isomerase family protein [Acidimicrobiales bacterium]